MLKAKIEQLENLNKLKSLKDSISDEQIRGKKKHAFAEKTEQPEADAQAEQSAAEENGETQLTFTSAEQ